MAQNIAARNNVKISGAGEKVLMFAHGFGCDQNMWRFVTPAFESEYKIIVFDYVGCGKSDLASYNEERYSTLNGYAEDVLEICGELKLHDIIFVGHSVSSMIGILASLQSPEIFKALIMVGPSPRYINDNNYFGGFEHGDLVGLLETMENNYIGWANFLAPVIMKNDDRPELTAELEESFCSTDPRMARKFAEVTFFSDNRRDLAELKLPVLIMQCSDDSIAPEAVGEYLHREIKHSKLVKLQATGHCPHMSHPEETIAVMREFLTEMQY